MTDSNATGITGKAGDNTPKTAISIKAMAADGAPSVTTWSLVIGAVLVTIMVVILMQVSGRINDRLTPVSLRAGHIGQQLSLFDLSLREKAASQTESALKALDERHDHAAGAPRDEPSGALFWVFLDRAAGAAEGLLLGEAGNGPLVDDPLQKRLARELVDSIDNLHLLVHKHLATGNLRGEQTAPRDDVIRALDAAQSSAAFMKRVADQALANGIALQRTLYVAVLAIVLILCLLGVARLLRLFPEATPATPATAPQQPESGSRSLVGNRTVIEATAEGYWEFDSEYGVGIDVNGSLCRMLGYGRDEIIGKRLHDFADPESATTFDTHYARKGTAFQQVFEIVLKHRSGREIYTRFYASTIRDENGEVRGLFALVTDISESMRARREMEDMSKALSQSNKNLATFATRASQVLRAPLDQIGGFADLVMERHAAGLDDGVIKYLEMIQAGTQNMNGTIDELLNQSAVSQAPADIGALDLNRTLQAALENFKDLKAWTSTEVSFEALPTIPGNAPNILAVFRALIDYAISRRRGSGTLSLHVAARKEDETWVVDFTDNGRPVPSAMVEAIREGATPPPGQEEHASALAFGRSIAEKHGGDLLCESDEETTRFSLLLPASANQNLSPLDEDVEAQRAHILVVDDQPVNTGILKALLEKTYDVSVAANGEQALQVANQDPQPDVILLDIMMPEMDGFEVCKRLKSSGWTKDIPVIFVSALDEKVDERRGLDLGAADYITKPISLPIVEARVATHLTVKRTKEALEEQSRSLADLVTSRTRSLEITQDVTILAMATLAETRDNETGHHIRRTQHYMQVLGNRLRNHPRFSGFLTEETIELLFKSAPLHDIGKVGIPDNILLKPGRLTEDEFEIMKKHTIYGYQAIVEAENMLIAQNQSESNESFLRYAREIAYGHHEKWDGSGYPNGLKGDEIPISARLMAVSDVYDALISSRVYKAAFLHERAVEIITDGRGSHFDPDIVDAFLEEEARFREIASTFADDTEEAA